MRYRIIIWLMIHKVPFFLIFSEVSRIIISVSLVLMSGSNSLRVLRFLKKTDRLRYLTTCNASLWRRATAYLIIVLNLRGILNQRGLSVSLCETYLVILKRLSRARKTTRYDVVSHQLANSVPVLRTHNPRQLIILKDLLND